MQPNITLKQAEKIACPICQGKRRVRRQDKVFCTRCQGTGWVEGLFSKVITCKKCAGNGAAIEFFDEACLNCEGKGWVVRMIPMCPACGRPKAECTCPVKPPGEAV